MNDAPPHLAQNWVVTKRAARGRQGVVVAQAREAAQAGIAALQAGGNAVDAAVATAFALPAVEPWNSGLGGVGFAVVQPAGEKRASVVDFGPVAPQKLDAGAFPLTGRPGGDLFGWPEVEGDRNVHGPLSFCVPSAVAGYAEMHARWGRLPMPELLAPAIILARRGVPNDWYAALRILQQASILRHYPASARLYVPDGSARPNAWPLEYLPLGGLADTLERLARMGLGDFYAGEIADSLALDTTTRGGVLSRDDLRRYRTEVTAAHELPWRGRYLQVPGERTAGPAMMQVLEEMERLPTAQTPDARWYVALSRAVRRAQLGRLGADGSTSHICVVDAEGGMVSLTTTLLSSFGSRMVLPETGVLINNGVMWFDPRPGRANSISPGARPLTNMLPLLLRHDDAPVLAAGGSGGRKILSAVLQLFMFVIDFGMHPEDAAALPRIDVSSPDRVLADHRLSPDVLAALAAEAPLEVVEPMVTPNFFAAPSLVVADPRGIRFGVADVFSPWSAALAQ